MTTINLEEVVGSGATVSDDNFVGTQAESLPPVDLDFSCKSGGSNPEVVVDISQDDRWIRIPVSATDVWINKDGPSDITRTAKVQFPMEWGGVSIVQFINGFRSQNGLEEQYDPYDKCRIYFWDDAVTDAEDSWEIVHHGYVGGVGPSDDGTGKFWVYDLSDLMKGITVSNGFNNPSLYSALEFAVRGTDENGNDVGIQKRSPWNMVNYAVFGLSNIPQRKKSDVQYELDEDILEEQEQDIRALVPQYDLLSFSKDISEQVSDLFGDIRRVINNNVLDDNKRFQINRHNMIDYMEWITSLVNGRWWFEPFDDAPVLVVDATGLRSGGAENSQQRRYFVDKQAVNRWRDVQEAARGAQMAKEAERRDDGIDPTQLKETVSQRDQADFQLGDLVPEDYLPPHNYNIFEQVRTLNNNALADIKPFNTLELFGEGTTYRERDTRAQQNNYLQSSSVGAYTEEYPYVKVQYKPLLKRANGYEYSAPPIESDKIYLETAKQQAIKELRSHLAEETEGSITIKGEPFVKPSDYIVSTPVCNETYENVNAQPIEWEINGVHHKRHVGEQYTTDLTVSIAVEDRLIKTQSEYKET